MVVIQVVLQSRAVLDPFSGNARNPLLQLTAKSLITCTDQNVIRDILEGREYPRVFQVS